MERNEAKRLAFDEEIARLPPGIDIVYLDQCGISKDIAREYGRAPAGQRVYLPKSGRKAEKLNIMAGLLNGRLVSPVKYAWNTDAQWFLEWLEWCLLPLLAAGSVIVLDNASFHKKAEVHRIAASYGCRAIFLPPYSPDKNPIEKAWANLKNWLRLNAKKHGSIGEAVAAYFKTY